MRQGIFRMDESALSADSLTTLLSYHVTLLPRDSLTTLLSYHVTLLPRYSLTTWLSYHVTLLPRYSYHVTLLPRYSLTTLLSYHVTLLPSVQLHALRSVHTLNSSSTSGLNNPLFGAGSRMRCWELNVKYLFAMWWQYEKCGTFPELRSLIQTLAVTNLKQNEAQSARAVSANKGLNQRSKYVTRVQQRPESPTVTLTWHTCKYKVHKLDHRYILKTSSSRWDLL